MSVCRVQISCGGFFTGTTTPRHSAHPCPRYDATVTGATVSGVPCDVPTCVTVRGPHKRLPSMLERWECCGTRTVHVFDILDMLLNAAGAGGDRCSRPVVLMHSSVSLLCAWLRASDRLCWRQIAQHLEPVTKRKAFRIHFFTPPRTAQGSLRQPPPVPALGLTS